ncbi:MAG: hypothetical protein EBU49_06225 [Proteobacteria bacterium]|nr:hypothetical protein [Pseudomonadota bacterium]
MIQGVILKVQTHDNGHRDANNDQVHGKSPKNQRRKKARNGPRIASTPDFQLPLSPGFAKV